MRIKNIKINSYGNLDNKELDFSDGLNIVYGKNEAGKSTLLKFITNIFYGTSRNKKGREYSDYEKYKPWGKDDFSGKIKYELDNGEEYEVYREFSKKNPKIFNSNLEDISKDYSIDKNLGSQFFYEQTKVDEQTFLSTIASMQQEVKLEKNSQNVLVQKMANIAGTGEDNVSYQKALEKLYKKQLDEVGTNRSQGKPINIAQNKILELKAQRDNLLQYKDQKFNFEENKDNLDEFIEADEIKIELLKELRELNQQENIEKEKINYNKSIVNSKTEEIAKINEEKNRIIENSEFSDEENLVSYIKQNEEKLELLRRNVKTNNSTKNLKENQCKVNTKKYILFLIIALIINIVLFLTIKNAARFLGLIIFPIIFIVFFIDNKNKNEEQKININKEEMNRKIEENKLLISLDKNKELLNIINSKNAQINIIEKSKAEDIKKIEDVENKLKDYFKNEKEKIKNEYSNKLNAYDIDKLLEIDNINNELEKYQKQVNDRKLEIHRINLSKENIMPQLDSLAKVEENLLKAEEEFEELNKKNQAMIITKEALEKAYEKMKNTVTPKFTENLSKNISSISNGKYNRVSINDENGLMVELPSGEYVSGDKLSLGTIDQLYLSLRLSMCEEVSTENMPLILDEAFAFYDDERLENILRFLIDNYYDKQIIILTCTSREQEILNKLKYEYNKIDL